MKIYGYLKALKAFRDPEPAKFSINFGRIFPKPNNGCKNLVPMVGVCGKIRVRGGVARQQSGALNLRRPGIAEQTCGVADTLPEADYGTEPETVGVLLPLAGIAFRSEQGRAKLDPPHRARTSRRNGSPTRRRWGSCARSYLVDRAP